MTKRNSKKNILRKEINLVMNYYNNILIILKCIKIIPTFMKNSCALIYSLSNKMLILRLSKSKQYMIKIKNLLKILLIIEQIRKSWFKKTMIY